MRKICFEEDGIAKIWAEKIFSLPTVYIFQNFSLYNYFLFFRGLISRARLKGMTSPDDVFL